MKVLPLIIFSEFPPLSKQQEQLQPRVWDSAVLRLYLWQHHRRSRSVGSVYQWEECGPNQPNSGESHGVLPGPLPWKPGRQTLQRSWGLKLLLSRRGPHYFFHFPTRIALLLMSPMELILSSLWSLMTSTHLGKRGWIWCWSLRWVSSSPLLIMRMR